MNILVYAVVNRSGGALSVLNDFYNEAVEKRDEYPDVKWFFIVSVATLSEHDNIKILKYPDVIKSWSNRLYFELFTSKEIIRRYDIDAVVSLQNMGIRGCTIPTFISLHNILPAYRCGSEVFDSKKQMLKQYLVNRSIISSVRNAKKVFVSGEWAKRLFEEEGIVGPGVIEPVRCRIDITDDLPESLETASKTVFFYPSTAYPYKNHKVILEACKLLASKGIENYKVILTLKGNENATAEGIRSFVEANKLNIEFCGQIDREKVIDYYRKSVLLFPSKIEMDAMPLLECEAIGTYIIAADLPYSREILDKYDGKSMFPPDDSESLAKKMKDVIEGKVRQNGYKAVKEDEGQSRIDLIIKYLEKGK